MYKRGSLHSHKGFTLIELLVVIAIIAILAVVVVLTLNPAELLRQSRDSNRLSDLATLTSAINLYNTDQGGVLGYSLGLSSSTYLSITDPSATTTAGTNCGGLGGNIATNTVYFNCPASSTSRNVNATGWIPINFTKISAGTPIGSLPIDPTNTTSSNLYYTYQTNGNTFRIGALPESQKYQGSLGQSPLMFTAGSNPALDGGTWVPVPGNSTFGTNNFYVMKYDAVCTNNTTSAVVNTPADGGGYNNGTTACTPANGLQISSLPSGYPIVDITPTTAISYCQSIGAHLITNDEYMTIVTNASNQGSNWTGGSVGSGGMYLGNANNASEYPADPSDANGYAGETTKTVTNTNDERRTLTLSNGSVIWDMSGNVWETVARSTNNQGNAMGGINMPTCTGGGSWKWCQFSSISSWTSDVPQANNAPPNGAWSTTQGVGEIYTYGAGGNQGSTAFRRGDTWYDGSSVGPFALGVDWGTGNANGSVGFRCAR